MKLLIPVVEAFLAQRLNRGHVNDLRVWGRPEEYPYHGQLEEDSFSRAGWGAQDHVPVRIEDVVEGLRLNGVERGVFLEDVAILLG